MESMDTYFIDNNRPRDLKEIKRTWQSVENNIKTTGFGDGISFGRDSTFQNYFNQGFIEGFHSAYVVGECKGSLFCDLTQKNKELPEHQLIINPKSAWCQICVNKELISKNIAEIIAHQTEAYSSNMQQLEAAYLKQA